MKFTAERDDLLAACRLAASVVGRNKFIPILDCLLFDALDVLDIRGTDMDQSARGRCAAAITAPGGAAVDSDLVVRWLGCAPKALVHVEATDRRMTMTCGKTRGEFDVLDPLSFPIKKRDDGVEVVGGVEAIRICAPYADITEARPAIAGVHFDGGQAVAAQGNFICWTDAPSEASGTVPKAAVRSILALKGGRLFLSDTTWRVEIEGGEVSGQLIADQYPDWRHVIEKRPDFLFEADADDLAAAAERATLGRARDIIIETRDNELRLTGEAFEGATASIECFVDAECAPGLLVAFNARLFSTALKTLAGRPIRVSAGARSVVFLAPGMPNVQVMPLRDARQALPAKPEAT